MTITDILNNSPLPRKETEILVSFLLKSDRKNIITHPETGISSTLYKKFKQLEEKRLNNWPIAYLLGYKEFYGLNFRVTPDVLTPRPETEIMVEEIINLTKQAPEAPLIIDLGTGSGAVIVSVANELRRLSATRYKEGRFMAVDISAQAIKIAKTNAASYDLKDKIDFYCSNLLTPLKLNIKNSAGRDIIIAANLPYLTPQQIKDSPSISREPILALDGGQDGLKYYRELWQQITDLKLTDRKLIILCEIDPSQTTSIKSITKHFFPTVGLEIKKDFSRKNRFLIAKIAF